MKIVSSMAELQALSATGSQTVGSQSSPAVERQSLALQGRERPAMVDVGIQPEPVAARRFVIYYRDNGEFHC